MAHFSQQPRLLSIDSPLGLDTLLLTRIEGEEALSSLFSFEIEMYSTRQSILPAEIVVTPAQLSYRTLRQTRLRLQKTIRCDANRHQG